MTAQEIRAIEIPGVDYPSDRLANTTREFRALTSLCVILRELTALVAESNELFRAESFRGRHHA